MTGFPRYMLILPFFIALLVAPPQFSMAAQQAPFSLAVGQSVTVGQYTLVFRGLSGNLPAYDLYSGSVLLASFPLTASPPNPAEYGYANGLISIRTTGVTPDGTAVSGALTVR